MPYSTNTKDLKVLVNGGGSGGGGAAEATRFKPHAKYKFIIDSRNANIMHMATPPEHAAGQHQPGHSSFLNKGMSLFALNYCLP